jgi:hypothetical protein
VGTNRKWTEAGSLEKDRADDARALARQFSNLLAPDSEIAHFIQGLKLAYVFIDPSPFAIP